MYEHFLPFMSTVSVPVLMLIVGTGLAVVAVAKSAVRWSKRKRLPVARTSMRWPAFAVAAALLLGAPAVYLVQQAGVKRGYVDASGGSSGSTPLGVDPSSSSSGMETTPGRTTGVGTPSAEQRQKRKVATSGPADSGPSSPERSSVPGGVRIDSPREGARVQGHGGVVVKGTAADVSGALWLFIHAPDKKYYKTAGSSLSVANGHWSQRTNDIGGGPQDNGKKFQLVVLAADASCDGRIRGHAADGDQNVVFDAIPAGCRQVAGRQVRMTRF